MNNPNINKRPLVLGPSSKWKITFGIAAGILTLLAGSAFAFSTTRFVAGTVDVYDFGTVGGEIIGTQPAFVVISSFTMKPGDTVPWHYHKGVSYVILAHGTLTEQHLVGPGQCASEEVAAGSAFVESPGQVHNVINTGHDQAVIWWATIFPESDGVVRFTHDFRAGGVYPVNAPNCN